MRRVSAPLVLSIAGSDPSGGAGFQADLKTIAALGGYGLCAATAITVQSTRGVAAVHAVAPRVVAAQIRALLGDFDVGAIKIGMLGSAAVARAVVRELANAPRVPVVLDTVLRASRGAALLDRRGLDVLRGELLPLASVVTPNLPEASRLLGREIASADQMPDAARELLALGPRAVLLKGGHLAGRRLLDLFVDARDTLRFAHTRLAREAHGTGCALSSALAVRLAAGAAGPGAARDAIAYVRGALRRAKRRGRGELALLDHFWQTST